MNIVCVKCGAGVAYELASLTDQTVVVCSGCGAGLRVAFQVFDVPAASSPPRSASSPAQGRILVAVEGEATREMIRELLSGAGFEVIEAASGREVVAQVNQEQPALVLVDVNLSGMMGHEVCEVIRRLPMSISVKIILVAAIHNKARYRREPGNLFGADDFIERHQIEGDLVDKVLKLCQSSPPQLASMGPLSSSSRDAGAVSLGRGEQVSAAAPGQGAPATNVAGGPAPQAEGATAGLPAPAHHPVTAAAVPAAAKRAPPGVAPSPAGSPARSRATAENQAGPVAGAAAPIGGAVPVQAPPAAPDHSKPPIAAIPQPGTDAAPPTSMSTGPVSKPSDPGREAALRLARIIISDIALYNTKKVDESVLQGTFFDVMRHEIGEGRRLYEERRPPDLPRTVDLFQQTLDQFVATRKQLLQRNNQAAA
jgi:CheY-like chemotaxis protein